MSKPILFTVQPIHLDYPLFRYNVERFQKYFASVWIALSNHHQEIDYTNFFMQQMPSAHFVQVKHAGLDWRNDAVNETLALIKTDEPILFIEQDFLIKDDSFFEKLLQREEEFVYFTEGDRVHPAFALVKRELIEKTSKDFSANPPHGDHFYKFFSELGIGISLETLGLENTKDYFHLNGLSQNYQLFKTDMDPKFYRENNFLYYNYKCLSLPITNHPQFLQIEQAIERKHGHPETHPFLDRFFP